MAKAKKTDEPVTVDMPIRVRNMVADGYRRGGMKHKKGEVDHPPGTFTVEQLTAINDDPRMAVGRVPDAPKAGAPAGGDAPTEIEKAVDALIAANPDKVEEIKTKPAKAGWFVGQAMKQLGEAADVEAVKAAVKKRLGLPDES